MVSNKRLELKHAICRICILQKKKKRQKKLESRSEKIDQYTLIVFLLWEVTFWLKQTVEASEILSIKSNHQRSIPNFGSAIVWITLVSNNYIILSTIGSIYQGQIYYSQLGLVSFWLLTGISLCWLTNQGNFLSICSFQYLYMLFNPETFNRF